MAGRNDDAVWITGIGVATSLGNTYDELATNLMAGKSGVSRVTRFDTTEQPCRVAACLGPLDAPAGWDVAEFARLEIAEQMLIWTSVNALRDAGYWERRSDLRVGLVMGVGGEWVLAWEDGMHRGDDRVFDPSRDRTCFATFTRETLGLTGPSATVAAACASGNAALAQARRWLQLGWVDVCLVGACDRSVTPMGMAGFGNLGALSRRNDAPEAASRPFDRGRDGFVMGEGGAMFVLEPAGAPAVAARAYGEVAGVGATQRRVPPGHPQPGPGPCSRAIGSAMADARRQPRRLDYVNAHATSTPVGDAFETAALRDVLGDDTRPSPSAPPRA